MPQIIGFTHDKQLLDFTQHPPYSISPSSPKSKTAVATLSMLLHGVSGLSLVLLSIRASGHFLEYLCCQCQRQKWIHMLHLSTSAIRQ